jgi:hypothetical protein
MIKLFIGIDSFKDALYWWNENELPAFWIELNSGYYQINPELYSEAVLGNNYADIIYIN